MSEIRKVQQVGRSTLSVAIPKKWANEINLTHGSQVTIEKEVDGSFKIRTRITDTDRISKCSINVDKYKTANMLVRAITGLYLTGKHEIEIYSNKELKPDQLEQIRNVVQHFVGLGIIEQTSKAVIIHDFLDPAKFPFKNLIRHIFQTILFMQRTIINMLKYSDSDPIAKISSLENEVDRLYGLSVRQLLLVFRDGTVGSKIGISSLGVAVEDYVMVKCLEEIADHYEVISWTLEDATKKGLKSDNENLKEIISYTENLNSYTEKILPILIAGDAIKANKLINDIEDLRNRMELTAKKILEGDKKGAFIVNINSILWHLREIARQNRSVLETILNQCFLENKDMFNGENTKSTIESLIIETE